MFIVNQPSSLTQVFLASIKEIFTTSRSPSTATKFAHQVFLFFCGDVCLVLLVLTAFAEPRLKLCLSEIFRLTLHTSSKSSSPWIHRTKFILCLDSSCGVYSPRSAIEA